MKSYPPAAGLLPSKFHRIKGTVKKTKAHIARVKAAQKREKQKCGAGAPDDPTKRSSKWPTARRKFLKSADVADQGCAACGAKQGLQVHHCIPFHNDPSKELDPTNFVALCEFVGGLECHEKLGHGGNFKMFNPTVRADAAELRAHPDRLTAIQARAKAHAKPNVPGEN